MNVYLETNTLIQQHIQHRKFAVYCIAFKQSKLNIIYIETTTRIQTMYRFYSNKNNGACIAYECVSICYSYMNVLCCASCKSYCKSEKKIEVTLTHIKVGNTKP